MPATGTQPRRHTTGHPTSAELFSGGIPSHQPFLNPLLSAKLTLEPSPSQFHLSFCPFWNKFASLIRYPPNRWHKTRVMNPDLSTDVSSVPTPCLRVKDDDLLPRSTCLSVESESKQILLSSCFGSTTWTASHFCHGGLCQRPSVTRHHPQGLRIHQPFNSFSFLLPFHR